MTAPVSSETIKLEYRVAVLEGIVSWMLTNGVFVKSIEAEEMENIHSQAVNIIQNRYPDAQIELEGRWEK